MVDHAAEGTAPIVPTRTSGAAEVVTSTLATSVAEAVAPRADTTPATAHMAATEHIHTSAVCTLTANISATSASTSTSTGDAHGVDGGSDPVPDNLDGG